MRMVLMGLLLTGCLPLNVDELARTAARNEVAAIRDARGRTIVADGTVTEVRLPLDQEAQKGGGHRDLAHSSCVELTTDEGTPVKCYLDGTQFLSEFVAGTRVRLSGKLYDSQQDADGKITMVILQRWR